MNHENYFKDLTDREKLIIVTTLHTFYNCIKTEEFIEHYPIFDDDSENMQVRVLQSIYMSVLAQLESLENDDMLLATSIKLSQRLHEIIMEKTDDFERIIVPLVGCNK